jgi:LmbE family N-acetylglucosaminyl deacetylase
VIPSLLASSNSATSNSHRNIEANSLNYISHRQTWVGWCPSRKGYDRRGRAGDSRGANRAGNISLCLRQFYLLMITPKKLVVVSPHPDDETLGCGGTIARFAGLGAEVSVLVVSGHLPPLYDREVFEISRKEAEAAFGILGVTDSEFLTIPATLVKDTPVAKLNGQIGGFIRSKAAEMVLIPFPDRHVDHRVIFDACVVACRPTHPAAPTAVLAYETLSETHWNVPGIEPAFVPEFFIDVTRHMPKKKAALECYASQISHAPSRSIEASMALARFRGSQNGCCYAEAFKVVRIVV